MTAYRDPFSYRADEVARQAILRADSLGMEKYGPAPAPLDERRDLYQEAIEELLDAIYYLTRQVAQLEDLRDMLSSGETVPCRPSSPLRVDDHDTREFPVPVESVAKEGGSPRLGARAMIGATSDRQDQRRPSGGARREEMAMLKKTAWILLLLREKPLDRIRLMKGLFLIWHRSGRDVPGFFEFAPYMYGPCSFELYDELEAAARDRLLTQLPESYPRWSPYYITERGKKVADRAAEEIDPKMLRRVRSVAEEVAGLDFNSLLRRVYKEAPDFATDTVAKGLRQ
jgi:hypothetical protein